MSSNGGERKGRRFPHQGQTARGGKKVQRRAEETHDPPNEACFTRSGVGGGERGETERKLKRTFNKKRRGGRGWHGLGVPGGHK